MHLDSFLHHGRWQCPFGVAPMAQCDHVSKQSQNDNGCYQTMSGSHSHAPLFLTSMTNTACHERPTARRPKNALIGNESAVASASKPNDNLAGRLRTCGNSCVLKGAGSTPANARRSTSQSRIRSRQT